MRRILDRHNVIVCTGSGGVGKTTIAAALGLVAARAGRKVLVLTVDPARRLADALGVGHIGNEARRVGRSRCFPGLKTNLTRDGLVASALSTSR